MSVRQLRLLVGLRWRMVRARRVRWGFAALAAIVPVLGLAAIAVGLAAPSRGAFDVTLLAPTAYVSVALLALLAPLVAGGGNELFPDDQLVAYPVTARTHYLTSMALTPLNLAWTTQLVGLLGVTAYIAPRRDLVVFALLTCLAYIALVTVAGQALAWVVVGVRQRPAGRRLTWALAGAGVAAAVVVVATGNVAATLDRAPTTYVVLGALDGATGRWASWSVTTILLAALTLLAWMAGREACRWALRQPGGAGDGIVSRDVARRAHAGLRRQVLAVDRSSVWRSPSLRRGLIVLGVLPGAVAAAAALDWPSLVLLPGLVAAGAGLLFGVNVFCLDGNGAVWLASQPHRPSTVFWSKATVVLEVCAVAILLTMTAGSLRTGRWPTAAELAAMVSCAVVVTTRVVALCMELSVSRPHRADLRGPRDTPAPPGVMAAYSVRLALSTTLVGVVFSGLAEVATWQWSVLVASPLVLLSLRRLARAARLWQDPHIRSRVVVTVASG